MDAFVRDSESGRQHRTTDDIGQIPMDISSEAAPPILCSARGELRQNDIRHDEAGEEASKVGGSAKTKRNTLLQSS